ncbi:hypothetical protein ACQJBY_032321 [Aegilops geniculata]
MPISNPPAPAFCFLAPSLSFVPLTDLATLLISHLCPISCSRTTATAAEPGKCDSPDPYPNPPSIESRGTERLPLVSSADSLPRLAEPSSKSTAWTPTELRRLKPLRRSIRRHRRGTPERPPAAEPKLLGSRRARLHRRQWRTPPPPFEPPPPPPSHASSVRSFALAGDSPEKLRRPRPRPPLPSSVFDFIRRVSDTM